MVDNAQPDGHDPGATAWWLLPRARAVLLLVCVASVVVLAHAVGYRSGLVALDHRITAQVVAGRTPLLNGFASAITLLGNEVTLSLLTLATVGTLWWREARGSAAFLATAMAGSAVLTVLVKNLVMRTRPPVEDVVGEVLDRSYSFPSGHTLNSSVFLVAVLCLVLPRVAARPARVALVALGVLLAAGVGASRVYLGFHWASDVVGAWLVAAAWMTLLCLVVTHAVPHLHRGHGLHASHPRDHLVA